MLALVLACIAQGNPKQTLDAFVAAEAANSKQSLTIVVSSNLSGTSTKTTYELAFTRPNRLRMEVRENTPPTDRVFTINRNGRIVLKEHGVGGPQPPSDPMSLEQFADFVLATALEEKTA